MSHPHKLGDVPDTTTHGLQPKQANPAGSRPCVIISQMPGGSWLYQKWYKLRQQDLSYLFEDLLHVAAILI